MGRFRLLLLIIGIVVPSFIYAQDKQNGNAVQGSDVEYAFEQLEVKPEFPNGNEGLAKYLSENIKYPKKALKNGITGKVFVQFVIDKSGKVTNVVAVRGVEKSLDKEAVRVIKAMPKWKPGKKDGQPVNVKYTIPINFKF
ncbi:MAG: energy transducer TonB [Bacteroidales bacterium]|nr:energy transducer TonB [Bacteroidales bacterium]